MKAQLTLILIAIIASLSSVSANAQMTFNFTTSLGSGSFTLNPDNLVYTGDNGSAAGFNDVLDSLTFDGATYNSLNFSVYNDSFITGGKDGFQIMAGAQLEIDVAGDSSVVSGISTSDLMTVLQSFDALHAVSFSSLVLYNDPNPPYDQLIGSVISFQAVPEPSVFSFVGMGIPMLLAFRFRR